MKKLFNILAILLLALSLCCCHGSHSKNIKYLVPLQFDETRNYEITFWAKNDTNLTQVAAYKKAIEDFENYYPNINVVLKLYTDYSRIYNDVITNIATNTTPNVCITYPDHIATYLTGNNTVVCLDDLYSDTNYGLGGKEIKYKSVKKEEIIPQFLNEGIINGSYYALPFMRSSEILYINKTYLEKMGEEIKDVYTWDDIFTISSKAMEKDETGNYKVNGQNILIPFIYKSTDNMMIQMLKQENAPYSDSNGNIKIFNEQTSDILKKISINALDRSFSTFKISSYPGNFMNAGQCLFAIDSSAGSTWIGSNAPLSDLPEDKKVDFETVVRIIPQFDINNPKMISQGPSIAVFNKEDPQEVLASWLFAQFLLTDDVQFTYASSEAYVPVSTNTINSNRYQEYLNLNGVDNDLHYNVKIDSSKLLLNNIDNTFVTDVFNGSTSLRNAAGELIEQVCKDVKKGKTIDDDYLNNLYNDMTSLYRLNESKGLNTDTDLGPLPLGSKILLSVLAIVWIFIIIYYCLTFKKNKRV